MNKNMFLNIAVKDLPRAKEFFSKLGYTFNLQFTDETAACMVVGENIYAMLLTEEKFKMFTTKAVADSKKVAEVLIALSCESKEEVNTTMQKAIEAGGKEFKEAKDYGFMFSRSFEDLDGHVWEYLWMDPSFVK